MECFDEYKPELMKSNSEVIETQSNLLSNRGEIMGQKNTDDNFGQLVHSRFLVMNNFIKP